LRSSRKHDTTHSRLRAVDVPRTKPGFHHDGGGLYLDVRPSASGMTRVWVFRYTRHGRAHTMGLGPLHTISLKDARERAREARRLLLDGVDPIDAREAHRAAQRVSSATTITFKDGAERYIDAHSAGWGPKQEPEWRSTLARYAYPVLGPLPVSAINVALVMRVLEPIWAVKPELASRVRGRIEAVLGWATVHGYRSGENPARWGGHLQNLLPKRSKVAPVEHHPALPYPEIAAFMVDLRAREGVAARALQFAILTAARTGEVIGARWDEIDVAERLWIVPGERMKSGREHRVPLSDAALAALGPQGAPDEFVFPGRHPGQPIGHTTLFALLQRMGRGDLTVHGFRATFRQWAAERTSFPREVAELALAHAVGDAVERAYQRSDLFQKRRQLADAWAWFCAGAGASQDSGQAAKVVPLRARR
jgi:integrase